MSIQMSRRSWIATATAAVSGMAVRGLEAAEASQGATGGVSASASKKIRDIAPYALYAFDNGLNGPDVPTVEAKVALLKRLGYAGMTDHFGTNRLPQVLDELDKHGLEFVSLYVTPMVEDEVDTRLLEEISRLKVRKARIEIGFRSRKFKPSDPAADEMAVAFLRRLADAAADTGPVISIYPHRGFWTERVEDGLRLARKVALKTVGTNFNLVHWQWCAPVPPAEAILKEALPHLMLVTINGLDKGKIVPLPDGDFDVKAFMGAVHASGYVGPVGLQCYSIPGPSEPHLTRSMAKWIEIKRELGLPGAAPAASGAK